MNPLSHHFWSVALVVFGVAGALGCADRATKNDEQSRTDSPRPGGFDSRVLEVARNYESYGRLDGQYRWAPVFCSAPRDPRPSFSASPDAETHGQKLYSLFVKEMPSETLTYTVPGKPSPVGQAIVKESWVPEAVAEKEGDLKAVRRTIRVGKEQREDVFFPYARKGGRLYLASRKSALFVMLKLDPATPETDEGWVYGTVTADGTHVTASGRLESCMGCHRDAPHDRLFGPGER
jgi:hypothetical protein